MEDLSYKIIIFFKNNYEFEYNQFIKLNKCAVIDELEKMSIIELIEYYNVYGKKNNLLLSIKEFYILYPSFDVEFYKKYYKDLDFSNDIKYLAHYHFYGYNEKRYYSLNNFIEINNIDLNFIKRFYKDFFTKKYNYIFDNFLINYNLTKYILSIEQFYLTYPNFDLQLFKFFQNIHFEEDIDYISFWYHIAQHNNNCIASFEDFYKINNYFEKDLYKFIYNLDEIDYKVIIDWYNKKNYDNHLIYSYDTFNNNIDDFMYEQFIKNNYHIKTLSNNEIINYYIKNILTINKIYSEKLFLLKYPKFIKNEYIKLNNITSSLTLFNLYNEYHTNINNNIYYSIKDFYTKNPSFNLIIYKYNLNKNNVIFDEDIDYISFFIKNHDEDYYLKLNKNISINLYNATGILYIEDFNEKYPYLDKEIYKTINNLKIYDEEELLIHYYNIGLNNGLPYNLSMFNDDNIGLNLRLYKELNYDLIKLSEKDLFLHWNSIGKNQNRIYSIKTFYDKYPNLKGKIKEDEDNIIKWMKCDIYKQNNIGMVGRKEVYDIYEVLIDLEHQTEKNMLEKGISLIIRAKNEEVNIKDCIESVVDLVDEIIFVDNGSTDKTYQLVEEYCKIYKNIKLYKYNIKVSKVGIEHEEALQYNNPNTLGTFYNWCLSKSTKINVFKWDADFLCIRNNLKTIIKQYNLREREDKFAIWFTGITMFENNDIYYINQNSYYNEYRIFSFKNGFCWYDGNTCEYTEPYLKTVNSDKKYIFEYPLFYELKRTSIDEFQERSSMIDIRDINDEKILNDLKQNNNNNLVRINKDVVYDNKKIIIYTPSLSFGGGNQFIIEIYYVYKSLGFDIKIIPIKMEQQNNEHFSKIINDDIIEYSKFNYKFIDEYKPDFIIMNSDIPFDENTIKNISKITKLMLVTHSDVGYSNYFIQKFEKYIYRIITVNKYVIDKISGLLNIDKSKFYKLINYTEIKEEKKNKNKTKRFGIISRFSEDKNIPMLIYSLKDIFKKYPSYKCYLIGTHTERYDDYLKYLCKINGLERNIFFEGYKPNVKAYYDNFDFIVLPSVSEGCSYNIIESMSLGIPVVVSDVGGNHELIINNINGYIYPYTDIRKLEQKTVYITNYNEHLSKIGYIINSNIENKFYNLTEYKDIDVILPHMLKCIKHNTYNKSNVNCDKCQILHDKLNIFNKNMNNLQDSIIKMIETPDDKYNQMVENNKNFIRNNYNKYIYYNQLIDIINTI